MDAWPVSAQPWQLPRALKPSFSRDALVPGGGRQELPSDECLWGSQPGRPTHLPSGVSPWGGSNPMNSVQISILPSA